MQDRPTKTKPNLFTPIEIGPLELPNRIVMAQGVGPARATFRPASALSITRNVRAQA